MKRHLVLESSHVFKFTTVLPFLSSAQTGVPGASVTIDKTIVLRHGHQQPNLLLGDDTCMCACHSIHHSGVLEAGNN